MDSSDASANSRLMAEASARVRSPDGFGCRLEWRRSRWMMASLCLLAVAACGSLWLSNLPPTACIAGDGVVAAWLVWLLWREASRPPAELAWVGGDTTWQVVRGGTTRSLRHVETTFRGSLAVLTLVDDTEGHRERYVWWPDTLDASARRSLRLAATAMRSNEARRADA